MIYKLLGELDVRHEGRGLDLPTGYALTLLGALLLNANRQMSHADLLKAAWGSTAVGITQLHKQIATLRTLLNRIDRRDDLVTHRGFGYEMRMPESESDLLVFERLIKEADAAQTDRRAEDELKSLREALGLWRGTRPLANVSTTTFQERINALQQRRKRALIRAAELDLGRRDYARMLDVLSSAASEFRTDSRMHELLMITLHRHGQATEAYEAYERHAKALAEQTGAEPAAELRDLNYAIARGDDEWVAAAETRITGWFGTAAVVGARPDPAPVPRQLPPDLPDLVGREDLIAEATWLLGRAPQRAAPVLVISGPGGIGKTALARRIAHLSSDHYPDGQLYAQLGAAADRKIDTAEVLAQLLRAFHVPVVPDTREERIAAYRTMLSDRRVLVVLDDAANEAQIRDLVPANPACGVLVTSRRRLPGISGVHHVPPLAPLRQDTARELFLKTVARAGIDLTRETKAVEAVVALCGGLPLALRIAASLRVHEHPRPTAELARRLAAQGTAALRYGDLNVARTIGAGLDRLGTAAQRLFLGLGLVPLPRAGLWTAAAVLDDEGDPGTALSELAASTMIDVVEADVRYQFHELTRDYAHRRALTEYPGAAEQVATCTRVYRALLSLTRRAHATLYGGDFEVVHSTEPPWTAPADAEAEVDDDPLAWFDKERLNIRAAVDHCAALGLTELCWDLAVSAHEFYTIGAHFDDWHATHTTALHVCRQAGDSRGEGIVLACLGQPALVASRRASGTPTVAELHHSVTLLAAAGDRHGQAIALRTLANALRRGGQLTRPLALFDEALGHYEASGDAIGRWQALRFIGQTRLDMGQPAKALEVLNEAKSLACELGTPRPLAQTEYWIGQSLVAAGDLDGARTAFLAILREYCDASGIGRGYALQGLAQTAVRAGSAEEARRYLDEAMAVAATCADALLDGRTRMSAAEFLGSRGQREQQMTELRNAITRFAECGAVHLQAAALHALGNALTPYDPGAAKRIRSRIAELYAALDVPFEDQIFRS
ncbi:AfsR/SARP family transcriptional regulator [Amycolatopsis sp. NBC_00438]|uniref:AfsR/SARP family transcriptional regulator n=1 Tax=Amycolatopsis sp. NBC_00438 TaxID=2903558 RepID=UPI002E1CCFF7